MRKIMLIPLIMVFLLLFACSVRTDKTIYHVIVPNGSTAMAQALIELGPAGTDTFDFSIARVAGPQPLVASFGSESDDFIIAPLTLGAKMIDAGSDYALLATITEGNVHLASGQAINSFDDLEGASIIAFGKGAPPGVVLETLLNAYPFENPPTIERYATNTQETMNTIIHDPDAIALVAEPFLSTAFLRAEHTINSLDLTDSWVDMMGMPPFPQAGVFVHNNTPQDVIEHYASMLEDAILFANDSPDELATLTASLNYPFAPDVVERAVPNSRLRYTEAQEAIPAIEAFFTVLINEDPEIIGESLPEESFYYNP